VATDPGYISRDGSAKSELVAPVFVNGSAAGILDVNSHFTDAFTREDRQLCETAAEVVGQYISSH
jgi:putative methionine-R-sulfoxide reductase with GAF domain